MHGVHTSTYYLIAHLQGCYGQSSFITYVVESWVEGDPDQPKPPESRKYGRNAQDWRHLFNRDVISMPDKWEYPWVSEGGRKRE